MRKKYDVKSIEKNYPALTSERKKSNPCEYELGLIMAYTSEMHRGFKVSKKNGVTKNGTKIEFAAFKNEDEVKEYERMVLGMAKQFEEKYEGWDILSLLKKS